MPKEIYVMNRPVRSALSAGEPQPGKMLQIPSLAVVVGGAVEKVEEGGKTQNMKRARSKSLNLALAVSQAMVKAKAKAVVEANDPRKTPLKTLKNLKGQVRRLKVRRRKQRLERTKIKTLQL